MNQDSIFNLNNIPEVWGVATLSEIAKNERNAIKRGPFGSAIKKSFFVPTGYKVYEQKNVIYNDFKRGSYYISDEKFYELESFKVKAGDILMSCSGTVGKLSIVPFDFEKGIINQALLKITLNNNIIYTRFFFYLFGFNISRILQKNTRGSAMLNISSVRDLKNIQFPIPPLTEQQRIVDKIEELFTKLDTGVEALKQAQAKLKRYRQSVLKAAVEGRLTAEWREQHLPASPCSAQASKDKLEPTDKLLDRILKERREKWESQQLAKFKTNGKKTPVKWQNKYKESIFPNSSSLPELPESWKCVSIDQISYEVRYGSSSKTNTDPNGIPILRMGNIVEGNLVFDKLKYLTKNHDEFPDLLLVSGDLLFNRTNSVELVGKTAIYKGYPYPCSYASYLIRVRFSRGVEPNFISFFINSVYGRAWIRSVVSQQVGQANVNGTKLKNLAVPLPSFDEQKKIVSELERLFSIIYESESLIHREINRAQSLRQSILKRAFDGKLVPQDPNDLPAPQPGKYFIYVLECSNGSYYIGHTENIEKRWINHAGGGGADWTRKYPPVALVHWEEYNTRTAAAKREKELKTGFGRKWIKREIKEGRTRQAGEPASVLLERIKSEKSKSKKSIQMEIQ